MTTPDPTPTPRTDAQVLHRPFTGEESNYVLTSFARTCERENAALREALESLRSEIEPIAKQIICPADNTFSRQLKLIDTLLNPKGTE